MTYFVWRRSDGFVGSTTYKPHPAAEFEILLETDIWDNAARKIYAERGPSKEYIFNERWGKLAAYNERRAQGIEHTTEYRSRMERLQRQYDLMQVRGLDIWYDPIPELEP